jgi:hypothetical protein
VFFKVTPETQNELDLMLGIDPNRFVRQIA